MFGLVCRMILVTAVTAAAAAAAAAAAVAAAATAQLLGRVSRRMEAHFNNTGSEV